ncbi:GIDE domain-containing protein [Geminocystis sp. CENA526]|uniref:GIDE domain-containing protein n=1 Tax=Geminocystis sp. CENA526 TaxID=1355871 RepID=UPI003D6F07DB
MLNNRGLRNDRRTLGYRYTESILPVGQEVLIIGQVSDETGDLKIIKPANNKEMFLISLKTNEALIHSYGESQKYFLIGSIVCGILGIILMILSIF